MATYDLAFIGAGNMAEAIARGVIVAGLMDAARMIAADPVAVRRDVFASLGVAVADSNAAAVAHAACVLLAVKPQQMAGVLEELAGRIRADALVVSIAAGVSAARIESALRTAKSANPRVVRAMPNTPMLAGAGMTALVGGAAATDPDIARARRLFECAGRTLVVRDERLIDAVTAVSGSGPAYFFYLVEAMVAAGQAEGLSAEDALALATQTCAGAAKLLIDSKESPRELRRRVTSPGGTTQAACDVLDARDITGAFGDAIRAAAARSRELGR